MKEDAEEIVMEFNNVAASIFASFFEQFSNSARKLDRGTDENVFQMQIAKYVSMIRSRLEQQAQKYFTNYSGTKLKELQSAISARIAYYLQEFRSKCYSL